MCMQGCSLIICIADRYLYPDYLFENVFCRFSPVEDRFEDLVVINENGQLSVNKDRAIDADVPPTHHLKYFIYATDCKEDQTPELHVCFKTEEQVSH